MPKGDGTGPLGWGPGSSRRMGCRFGKGVGKRVQGGSNELGREVGMGIGLSLVSAAGSILKLIWDRGIDMRDRNRILISNRKVTIDKNNSDQTAVVDEEECLGCGVCLDICSRQAIALIDIIAKIDTTKCNGCGDCSDICPTHAISLK